MNLRAHIRVIHMTLNTDEETTIVKCFHYTYEKQ